MLAGAANSLQSLRLGRMCSCVHRASGPSVWSAAWWCCWEPPWPGWRTGRAVTISACARSRRPAQALGVPVQLGRDRDRPVAGAGCRRARRARADPARPHAGADRRDARCGLRCCWASRCSTPWWCAMPCCRSRASWPWWPRCRSRRPRQRPVTSEPVASLPRRIVLDQVTWVDASKQRLTVNADIAFAGELLPETARIEVVGGRLRRRQGAPRTRGRRLAAARRHRRRHHHRAATPAGAAWRRLAPERRAGHRAASKWPRSPRPAGR